MLGLPVSRLPRASESPGKVLKGDIFVRDLRQRERLQNTHPAKIDRCELAFTEEYNHELDHR